MNIYIEFLLKELFWRLKKTKFKLVSIISQAVMRKKPPNPSNFLGERLTSFCLLISTQEFGLGWTVDSTATHGSLFLRQKVYAPRTIFFENNFISEIIMVLLFILKKLFSG